MFNTKFYSDFYTLFLSQELNLLLMAIVYLHRGDKDQALTLLTNSVSLSPTPSLQTLYNYSLLLTQQGKLKEASSSWLKRRGLLPNTKTEARHKIIDIQKKTSTNQE